MTYAILVLIGLLFIASSSPWTNQNSAQNVNFNPTRDPSSYYGKYPYHTYFSSPTDLRSDSIYQFITDRFANGNPENDDGKYGGVDLDSVGARHGGDFEGIKNKLDYIKSLGFTAIWISPIFQNLENSYHGYAQIDFTLIDDRFGTLDEFREMVDQAHKRGIRVIVDIVVNHMANLLYFEGHESSQAPFHMHSGEYQLFYRDETEHYEDFDINNTYYGDGKYCDVYGQDGYAHKDTGGSGSFWFSDYHHNGDLTDYSDPYCNNLGKIYGIMDDLRTTHPRVTNKIIAMTKSLITSTDIDGIRMDTPMQVPLDFFKTWVPAVKDHAKSLGKDNFLIFAEFYCSKNFAADMTGRGKTPPMYKTQKFIDDRYAFNGGINYPLYSWFQDTIKGQKGGVSGILNNYYEDWDMFDFYNPYSEQNRYTHCNFFNNHDQWRMAANDPDGFRKQDLSAFLILFFPGIPLFYYGDEQGLLTLGTALDGYSREDMMTSLAWDNLTVYDKPNKAIGDNFDMTDSHFLWVKKLNMIRKFYEVYDCDEIVERYTQTKDQNGLLLWSKSCTTKDDNWILFGFNNWKLGISSMGGFKVFNEPSTLVNVLNPSENYTLDSKGFLSGISFDGYEAKIFVKEERMLNIPPYVKTCSPVHDSSLGDVDSVKFSVQFDQKMESLKDAFGTSEGLAITSINCGEANMYCEVDTKVLQSGIHYIQIDENKAKSAAGVNMYGTFFSRVRIGLKDNILVNRKATNDYRLISIVSGNQIKITHKAVGAEKFRIFYEKSNVWSNWNIVHSSDLLNAPDPVKQLVKVQYYVDNSAAYIINSEIE